MIMDTLIHTALRGEKTVVPPIWLMRQAGRYLPEYREIRKDVKDFLSLCYSPGLAAEVTLQPIRRFDMDAAILFSDILVIPHAMGQQVEFLAGEGPRLAPIRDVGAIEKLDVAIERPLATIGDTVKKVREQLAAHKSLIGFCGAPWTVACYMVEGRGSRDFDAARGFAYAHESLFAELIERVVEASFRYLSLQVESGADVLQIFDSWAGVLSEPEYHKWVIAPTRKLVAKVKARHPGIAIIGFPKGSGALYEEYAGSTGVDAVGLDTQVKLDWAKKTIGQPLQGNLDPIALASNKAVAVAETRRIMQSLSDRAFIFNLGHGIIPSTPIENVQAVCDTLRGIGS